MKLRVKLNAPLNGHKIGDIIDIDNKDQFWRRRLKDAKIDNCIEIIEEKKIEIKKEETKIGRKK